MRATINFLKHKSDIKAYERRLDLRPQNWPLKMLKISVKEGLKMGFTTILERKIKRAKICLKRHFLWKITLANKQTLYRSQI